MPKQAKQTESEAEKLIETMVQQTRDLLENSWAELQSCRKRDSKIKITVVHNLEYLGGLRTVKTKIGFGHKFADQEETSFDLNQLEFADA